MTTGGICYREGYERGAWFELLCLRENIAAIEAAGGDATEQRSFYRAWLKDPDFAKADKENRGKGLYGELTRLADKQEVVSKIGDKGNYTPPNYETTNSVILSPDKPLEVPGSVNKRGRPRKTGEVSRATEWRRQKEGQAVLL